MEALQSFTAYSFTGRDVVTYPMTCISRRTNVRTWNVAVYLFIICYPRLCVSFLILYTQCPPVSHSKPSSCTHKRQIQNRTDLLRALYLEPRTWRQYQNKSFRLKIFYKTHQPTNRFHCILVHKVPAPKSFRFSRIVQCVVFGQWRSVEELADGPTECGEVARGGCLFAWNFSVKSTVLTQAERRTGPNTTLSPHEWLAPNLTFEISTGPKTMHCAIPTNYTTLLTQFHPGFLTWYACAPSSKLQPGKESSAIRLQ